MNDKRHLCQRERSHLVEKGLAHGCACVLSPQSFGGNIGALKIGIGFRGLINNNKEPQNSIGNYLGSYINVRAFKNGSRTPLRAPELASQSLV